MGYLLLYLVFSFAVYLLALDILYTTMLTLKLKPEMYWFKRMLKFKWQGLKIFGFCCVPLLNFYLAYVFIFHKKNIVKYTGVSIINEIKKE